MYKRQPVTFVNRAILGKLDQFKGIDKEKNAVEDQITFESELAELQEDFDELLELVEQHTDVYKNIPSSSQISQQIQKTKDNYLRMCLLAIGYERLATCEEEMCIRDSLQSIPGLLADRRQGELGYFPNDSEEALKQFIEKLIGKYMGKDVYKRQVAAMGRYMESTTPLPEGASVEGRNMAMLTDGRLAYFDAKTGLHLSPDEGKSWTPAENNEELLTNISEDGYVSGASIAPDGSMLLSYLMFEGEEASLKAV